MPPAFRRTSACERPGGDIRPPTRPGARRLASVRWVVARTSTMCPASPPPGLLPGTVRALSPHPRRGPDPGLAPGAIRSAARDRGARPGGLPADESGGPSASGLGANAVEWFGSVVTPPVPSLLGTATRTSARFAADRGRDLWLEVQFAGHNLLGHLPQRAVTRSGVVTQQFEGHLRAHTVAFGQHPPGLFDHHPGGQHLLQLDTSLLEAGPELRAGRPRVSTGARDPGRSRRRPPPGRSRPRPRCRCGDRRSA